MNKTVVYATSALQFATCLAGDQKSMMISLLHNKTGRDFIVGDLHGAFYKLQALLEHVHFNPRSDRLIAVGDLLDRGSHSDECLSLLDHTWFYTVRGNHEDNLLSWYLSQDIEKKAHCASMIQEDGGEWFFSLSDEEQISLCKKIAQLPFVIMLTSQNHSYCVIHAEIAPETDNIDSFLHSVIAEDALTLHHCLIGRRRHRMQYHRIILGVDFVVAGHTPILPTQRYRGNCLNLDFGLPSAHPSTALGMLEAGKNWLYLCDRHNNVSSLKSH